MVPSGRQRSIRRHTPWRRCTGQVFPESSIRSYDRVMDGDVDLTRDVLTSAYVELSMGYSAESGEIAVAAGRLLTLERVRQLVGDVGDPHPWVLVLRRLLQAPMSRDAAHAFMYVYDVAQRHLDEQGLDLLRPEDLLAAGPVERAAVSSGLLVARRFTTTPGFPRRTPGTPTVGTAGR